MNYDSSCYQASGENSEVIIQPKTVPCPFRKGNHKLVLCDTYNSNGEPHLTNKRVVAKQLFDKKPECQRWYGLEQEYFIIDNKTQLPSVITDRTPYNRANIIVQEETMLLVENWRKSIYKCVYIPV